MCAFLTVSKLQLRSGGLRGALSSVHRRRYLSEPQSISDPSTVLGFRVCGSQCHSSDRELCSSTGGVRMEALSYNLAIFIRFRVRGLGLVLTVEGFSIIGGGSHEPN